MADGYNYNLGAPYGGIPGYGGVPAKKPKSQVWNYDVAPIEAGYGREWEQRNTDEELARRQNDALLQAQKDALNAQSAQNAAYQRKVDAEHARQRAREAEYDRRAREAEARAREAEARERAIENANRQSAYDAVTEDFVHLGLDGGQVKSALKTLGRDDWRNPTKLAATIRSTQTWADRFGAVTSARKKAGLSYLSEAQIVGLEDGYKTALSQYGLPKSFYDSPKDFQNWIANDVSVQEVADRAKLASTMASEVDQGTKDAFKTYWGVGQGDLTAYFLDRTRATGLLEKQVKAAELGAEATTAGIGVTRGLLEDLAGKDIGREEMRQAAERTGVTQDDWKRLAQVSGQNLTQASLLSANLGLDVGTTKKLKKLSSQERGRFSGSGGGTGALGTGSTFGAY